VDVRNEAKPEWKQKIIDADGGARFNSIGKHLPQKISISYFKE
jgi:hypothetical protein